MPLNFIGSVLLGCGAVGGMLSLVVVAADGAKLGATGTMPELFVAVMLAVVVAARGGLAAREVDSTLVRFRAG